MSGCAYDLGYLVPYGGEDFTSYVAVDVDLQGQGASRSGAL